MPVPPLRAACIFWMAKRTSLCWRLRLSWSYCVDRLVVRVVTWFSLAVRVLLRFFTCCSWSTLDWTSSPFALFRLVYNYFIYFSYYSCCSSFYTWPVSRCSIFLMDYLMHCIFQRWKALLSPWDELTFMIVMYLFMTSFVLLTRSSSFIFLVSSLTLCSSALKLSKLDLWLIDFWRLWLFGTIGGNKLDDLAC